MRNRPVVLTPLLAALVGALLLVLMVAGNAAAAKPCWRQILDDWTAGQIKTTYPVHCYEDALRNMPEDLRDYSSAADDINAALQERLRQRAKQRSFYGSGGSDSSGTGGSTSSGTKSAEPDRSLYRRAIDNLGPGHADSLPIPLLVLASLGGLLLTTAAGMAVAKRLRAARAGRAAPPRTGT